MSNNSWNYLSSYFSRFKGQQFFFQTGKNIWDYVYFWKSHNIIAKPVGFIEWVRLNELIDCFVNQGIGYLELSADNDVTHVISKTGERLALKEVVSFAKSKGQLDKFLNQLETVLKQSLAQVKPIQKQLNIKLGWIPMKSDSFQSNANSGLIHKLCQSLNQVIIKIKGKN